jgi:hypothetical protein
VVRIAAAFRPDLSGIAIAAITNETLRFVPSRRLVPATAGPIRFGFQHTEKTLAPVAKPR